MAPQYVLILVHGTWADTTGWVAPGSFLRRALQRRLANVAFREFVWTSANTHAARTEAGDDLARFIRAGHAEHPEARHVLIAHSHGGNVVLYAMRDPAARAAVTGIVTLGTPFISARSRALHANVMAWLMLTVAILAPFALLNALQSPRLAFIWFFGGVVLTVTLIPALARWLTNVISLEQAGVASVFQPPSVDPSRLLVLRARSDEAGRWLRTWDVIAQGPFVIGWVLLSIIGVAARLNLPVMVDGVSRSTLHSGLDGIHFLGFDGWALSVGVVVLCVIWAVVLMASILLRWPGYWREPLLAHLLVDIGSNMVPRGAIDARDATGATGAAHSAYTFDVPSPSVRSYVTHGPLRHTAISEDPEVVGAIGEWIETRD